MSDPTERKSVSEQPLYILMVLALVGTTFLMQIAIPLGLYYAMYGSVNPGDLITTSAPEYAHVALWKGRIWHSALTVGPSFNGKANLKSFDPATGTSTESSIGIPSPTSGLLADGDRLWAISPNSVVRIEGEKGTEFKPKALLSRPCDPFLYEGKVAVIDMTKSGTPKLLVLEDNEWVEIGTVLAPLRLTWTTVDGKQVLTRPSTASPLSSQLNDIKVIAHNGQFHLFLADGSIVAYRTGLELATPSALAPDNVDTAVDLSDLKNWEVACPATVRIGLRGKDLFKAGLVDGQPVVITTTSSTTVPFQASSLVGYRRIDGVWQKTAEQQTPGMTELMTVTDGIKTYVGGQSMVQTLRMHEVIGNEIHPTGAVVKAPVHPLQQPMKRFVLMGQCIYWPLLLLLALGLSWLMSTYRESSYQFGLTTIELASITRRGIARVIDYFVYVIPLYFFAMAFGMSSQDQVEQNMDKMFDFSQGGMLLQLIWVILGSLLIQIFILVVTSLFQGYWGVTLGKWICGIRTVKTTLRPCGFLRSLLREILILVDTLFTWTWVPAVLCIAFTSCQQRLGDLAADTIVIRKPKIPD
ncbi:MAG: RDD family protein [Schlesneria sp.]